MWLNALWHRWYRRSRTDRRTPGRDMRRRVRLDMEPLEDRTVPSTFTVTNLNPNGSGSLAAAITASNSTTGSNTINFANHLHGTITLGGSELSIINNSVTINGPGANQVSVSGNNASRVFELATGLNVTISGLTITRGYALDQGGGILNDGSSLTLSGDILSQNTAYENPTDTNGAVGGAIDNLGGNLNITACTIADNQALGGAGASASGLAFGGGIDDEGGNLTIGNSTIQGNLAQGGAGSIYDYVTGGGIDTDDAVTGVVITNCVVSDNRAVAENLAADGTGYAFAAAGGVDLEGIGSISGTTFSGNESIAGNGGTNGFVGEAEGGAIGNYGPFSGGNAGIVTISGCTFDQNQAIGGSGGNSGSGNADPSVDESYGAGICNFGATLKVSGTTFSQNTSLGGNDGTATGTDIVEVGVAEGGAVSNEFGSTTTFSNCTFNHNQAIGGNGNTGSGPMLHDGVGFGAGIFSGFGGAAVGANTLTVTNTTFTQDTAQGGNNNSGNATVAGFIGAGLGGAIVNYLGGSATVANCNLANNQALGGTGNSPATALVGFDEPVLANLGGGGGILNDLGNYDSTGYGQLNNSVLAVNNSAFAGNLAVGGLGGGLWNAGAAHGSGLTATATVSNCSFTANQAVGVYNAAYPGISSGGGGGIENEGALTVSNSTFTVNAAIGGNDAGASGESEGAGGAIDSGDITPTGSLVVTNSSFIGNVGAGGSDAGVSVGAGGAVTAGSPTNSLSNCNFALNQALGGPVDNGVTLASQGLGGAINVYGWGLGFTCTVSNASFSGNEAIGGSGATSASPYGTIAFSSSGGAILAYYGATMTLTNSSFTHNEAIGGSGGPGGSGSPGIGGAIDDSFGENLVLSGSSFSQNSAVGGAGGSGAPGGDGVGGAISVDTGASATISHTTFSQNQALGGNGGTGASGGNAYGGGLSVGMAYPNSNFTGTATVTLSNSTFNNNSAIGGGGGSAGNGGDAFGGGIFINAGSSGNVTASAITKNDADGGRGGHGDADGTGIGGGVYNLGTFSYDAATVIALNFASTSNDNIFG